MIGNREKLLPGDEQVKSEYHDTPEKRKDRDHRYMLYKRTYVLCSEDHQNIFFRSHTQYFADVTTPGDNRVCATFTFYQSDISIAYNWRISGQIIRNKIQRIHTDQA